MAEYPPATARAGRVTSLRPAGGLFLTVILFLFFCPLLHAESELSETGDIRIREFQAAGRESVVSAASAPAAQPRSDEYGDLTAEDVGEAASGAGSSDEYGDVGADDGAAAGAHAQIPDPLRPLNVATYHFNDKVYFWVWKPASTAYKYAVPLPFRSLFRNFYKNLTAPVRIMNNLFQGEPGYAGEELGKFLINSTVGVGGLRDCAEECFGIKGRYADFGQTLGKYGVGFGFYLVLPFIGPSSPRDGFGFLVDWAMRPQTYVGTEFFDYQNVGLFTHEKINSTSFHLGEYEALKKAAVDPYVSMRDIYIQYRTDLIKNR